MSIKYFCDVTGQELDLDYPIYENERYDRDWETISSGP